MYMRAAAAHRAADIAASQRFVDCMSSAVASPPLPAHGAAMFGPMQPENGPNKSRRAPADFAADSLHASMATAAAGEAVSAGDAAAAAEVEAGCFAPFVATPLEQVVRLVALASIVATDHVCDLGFGDAKFLLGLQAATNCTVCGCEIDGDLVSSANATVIQSKVGHAVTLIESGIARFVLTPDFLRATVVFCFLVPDQLAALLPVFQKALSLGVRIVTQRYPIPGLSPLRSIDGGALLGATSLTDSARVERHDLTAAASSGASTADAADAAADGEDRYFPNVGRAFLYSKAP